MPQCKIEEEIHLLFLSFYKLLLMFNCCSCKLRKGLFFGKHVPLQHPKNEQCVKGGYNTARQILERSGHEGGEEIYLKEEGSEIKRWDLH